MQEKISCIPLITTHAPLRGASIYGDFSGAVGGITTHAPSRQTSQSIDSVLIGLGKLQLAPLREGHLNAMSFGAAVGITTHAPQREVSDRGQRR